MLGGELGFIGRQHLLQISGHRSEKIRSESQMVMTAIITLCACVFYYRSHGLLSFLLLS